MELYLSDVLPLGKNEFVCAITHNYVTKTQKYVAVLHSDILAKNQLNGKSESIHSYIIKVI